MGLLKGTTFSEDDKVTIISDISDLTSIRNPEREPYLKELEKLNAKYKSKCPSLSGRSSVSSVA